MIKYNNSNINDWNFYTSDIVKVYRNNAVCYYKITTSGGTPSQTPCYAVVDDISQYSDTEFVDVFNKADEKWYKLNNLNQYEEYGVYGSGRNITYYEGKLTIDNGYEYQYSGGSWVNLGEVSGGTASLPNVPFTVNYNAKNYDSQTKTLLKTSGQLADVDAVITAGTPTVNDGYLTIASGTRATISGYQTYFNRDNNNPNLTIISKQRTDGDNCHMFANRQSTYNWMYRPYATYLTLHGASEQGSIAVTTQPVIESVRVNSSRLATYNNYTDNTSSTQSSFGYGGTNSGAVALFQGYATNTGEYFIGDFYWVYMSQNTLTDDQVQQVIAYNEGGGGQPEYPMYYDEMQDPPNNLSFSSMTEAEAYECPWVGMTATIDGVRYIFSGDSISGYEWVKQQYTKVEYIQTVSANTLSGVQLLNVPNNTLVVEIDAQLIYAGSIDGMLIGQKSKTEAVSYQMGFVYYNNMFYDYGGRRLSTLINRTMQYQRHTYRIGRIDSSNTNKLGVMVDGVLTASTGVSNTSYENLPYLVGNPIYSGTSVVGSAKNTVRVYSVKIYEDYGATLVGDYIPVIKDDGTTITLYDKISGNYATPFGTLVAGNPV